jgi:hypothetical protein
MEGQHFNKFRSDFEMMASPSTPLLLWQTSPEHLTTMREHDRSADRIPLKSKMMTKICGECETFEPFSMGWGDPMSSLWPSPRQHCCSLPFSLRLRRVSSQAVEIKSSAPKGQNRPKPHCQLIL